MAAFQHYLECKAVGQFPADPIVRRNAGIIRMVEDMVARVANRMALADTLTMFVAAKRG